MLRYDAEQRDIIGQPRDWKKKGDTTTYFIPWRSDDKKAPYEVQYIQATSGSYVIDSTSVGPGVAMTTNCFGAPMITVQPGEIAYLGDFLPFMNAPRSDGRKYMALAHTQANIADAQRVLAATHPAIATAMRPATIHNGATYSCAGMMMTRQDFPGFPMIGALQPAAVPTDAPAAASAAVTVPPSSTAQ